MVASWSERVIHPQAVAEARGGLPVQVERNDMESFFRVLGDATRLRILYALLPGELCVCDLSETLGISSSALSHPLSVLEAARPVRHRRDGKVVYYGLSEERVHELFASVRVRLAE